MRLAGKFMRKEEQEVTECHQTSSGLYQPEYEHDACGVGMIVDIQVINHMIGGCSLESLGKYETSWRRRR
mgnify:CR=1 FL=1